MMDGSESVRSGHSERSGRSGRSHRSGRSRSDHRRNNHLIQIDGPGQGHTVNLGKINQHHDNQDDMIEVTIIPQDENWGDNTTAITGATSERSISVEEINRLYKPASDVRYQCQQYLSLILTLILTLSSFSSPLIFTILPRLHLLPDWPVSPCDPECEGLLISSAFKLIFLLIGSWALFFRRPKATLPRIFTFRCLILALIFLLTFCYWLFYTVRIFEARQTDYLQIVRFSVSLVDALLFIHYLAILLLELRHLQPAFSVKVVRSPDGTARHYNIGHLSIQRAATYVLEQYYRDFPCYNPYLDRLPGRGRGGKGRGSQNNSLSQFKLYDVDGGLPNNKEVVAETARAMMAANARKRDTSHNERFYEEQEYDRRVRRRKARLVSAAEEAFSHIRRLEEEKGPSIPMDPVEAAQAVFPSLARALQKYLRITRQQPKYTLENILHHLSICISHDLSPKAFLERYLDQGHVVWNDKEYRPVHTWALVSDLLLSRSIEDQLVFQLKNGDISLLVTVRKLPHFNVTEEVIEAKNNRFVLRLNSETSV